MRVSEVFEGSWLVKKVSCNLIVYRFVIPHDTIPSTVTNHINEIYMTIENRIMRILFYANASLIAFYIVPIALSIPLMFIYPSFIKHYFELSRNVTLLWFLTSLNILSIGHWILCLRFWYKNDKYSKAIFLLIFLHLAYSPFYYYQVNIKKRPLKNKLDDNIIFQEVNQPLINNEINNITRNSLLNLIELWSSKEEQIEFQEQNKEVNATEELFQQWVDFYLKDSETIKESFNDKEIDMLNNFNDEIINIKNKLKGTYPILQYFLKMEEWIELNKLAQRIITDVER